MKPLTSDRLLDLSLAAARWRAKNVSYDGVTADDLDALILGYQPAETHWLIGARNTTDPHNRSLRLYVAAALYKDGPQVSLVRGFARRFSTREGAQETLVALRARPELAHMRFWLVRVTTRVRRS